MITPSGAPVLDIVLRDGSTLVMRAAVRDDVDRLVAFTEELSQESRYYRFFGIPIVNRASIERLVPDTPAGGMAVVGECAGRIVAFAGYYPVPGETSRAEVALAIADALQGRGIGTQLLERLARIARSRGIAAFDAYVLGENRQMLEVFRNWGYGVSRTIDHGVYHVQLALEPTPESIEKAARRAQLAASASMKRFFEPRSVVVIGANRERGKIGAEILHNILAAGFTGTVVAIHPTADQIQGVRAYPRVVDVPSAVDLAIVAVPAAHVLNTVDDCLEKGVGAICVISAGFGEAGAEGRERERALLEKVRTAGCRLIGPNCMGLLNTDPAVRLNATFSPVYPPAGGVAMSTQSGALGLAILDYAKQLNIGISSFVSVGNKVDVSGNDLIQYWAEDPQTSVILLYLESFGNPRKFGEIARRVARVKPIVAVKAGRSTSGARAAASHTGALASSDTVVDALFDQAGVVRTDTLEEMFNVAALLAHQPVPRGRRVAILTNAGGPAILAADACEANGLELAALSDTTQDELRAFLPAAASVTNPVDMIASATPAQYRRALTALLRDAAVDSVVVIFIPPLVTEPDAVAAEIVAASETAAGKPILAVFMRAGGPPQVLSSIPAYSFPESAAIALARVTAYGEWKQKPAGTIPTLPGLEPERAKRVVAAALTRGGGWLTPAETNELTAAAGIRTAAVRVAATVEEAVDAAAAVGFPVALKAIGPTLLHKTERQAVRLDLATRDAVREAAMDFERRFGGEQTGFVVQEMVPGGVEMLVGALEDPTFGPVVVCGSGGILVDLLADSAFRMHPLTTEAAAEMIDELKGARLLRGYRGAAAADEAALADMVLRVSALLTWCPEIHELDLNPVKVLRQGACAVDARVRVEPPAARPATRRVDY